MSCSEIPQWKRHETRSLVLTLRDANGEPQNLDDDPGLVVEWQVKAALGGADPALVSLSLSGGGITKRTQVGADIGKLDIVVPYTAWASVTPGFYYHEAMALFTGSPAVRKYPYGAVYFELIDVVNAP